MTKGMPPCFAPYPPTRFTFPVSYLLFSCLVLLLFMCCHFSGNGPCSRLFFISLQKTLKMLRVVASHHQHSKEGGRQCWMSPFCLKSQGCLLIPLSYLLLFFFCLVLLILTFFQKNLEYFSLRVRLLCMALVELLGDYSL